MQNEHERFHTEQHFDSQDSCSIVRDRLSRFTCTATMTTKRFAPWMCCFRVVEKLSVAASVNIDWQSNQRRAAMRVDCWLCAFAPSREVVFPRLYAHAVVRFLQKAAKNRHHDVFAYFDKRRAGRGNHKETLFGGKSIAGCRPSKLQTPSRFTNVSSLPYASRKLWIKSKHRPVSEEHRKAR